MLTATATTRADMGKDRQGCKGEGTRAAARAARVARAAKARMRVLEEMKNNWNGCQLS